jgi:hypothetical protein
MELLPVCSCSLVQPSLAPSLPLRRIRTGTFWYDLFIRSDSAHIHSRTYALHPREQQHIIVEHYRDCVDTLRLVHIGTRAFTLFNRLHGVLRPLVNLLLAILCYAKAAWPIRTSTTLAAISRSPLMWRPNLS